MKYDAILKMCHTIRSGTREVENSAPYSVSLPDFPLSIIPCSLVSVPLTKRKNILSLATRCTYVHSDLDSIDAT
jgi:hypothetical protein